MELSSKAIDDLAKIAMYQEDETNDVKHSAVPPDAVIVRGLVHVYGFHPKRIKEIKPQVDELLTQLPDKFNREIGGGWSFLNMCVDRKGHQWTCEHQICEILVCLGIAVGSAEWLLLDLKSLLPGGVPYVSVFPAKEKVNGGQHV